MDLSKHVEEVMNKNKPSHNILCEICGQSFKTKNGYENHIKKHDSVEDDIRLLGLNKEGPCFCNICGKCFSQKASLSRHLPIHTGKFTNLFKNLAPDVKVVIFGSKNFYF